MKRFCEQLGITIYIDCTSEQRALAQDPSGQTASAQRGAGIVELCGL
jgi:hypothetical protein